MRLLFLGSPDFAVPALRALHEAGHGIACVVTRPDRRRGRHGRVAATPVKTAAAELGLTVYQPETVNSADAAARLATCRAELGVTVAFGEILAPRALAAAPRGFLNVHASLLPDYRGAAPINWAVIRGETATGVSIIRMTPTLDTGPVLARRKIDIAPEETAGELSARLSVLGAEALCDVVSRLAAGQTVEEQPQVADGGFFARKLRKEDGRLDWSRPAREVVDRVRGLTPWPGAYCEFRSADRSRRVTLLAAGTADGTGSGRPGEIVEAGREGLVVRAGDGAVRILRLKPAGSRAMDAGDFVRGYRVQPGDLFE